MKKKNKNVIKQYSTDYHGQSVTVSVIKPKEKQKVVSHARDLHSSCPNCGSKLVINVMGAWECTSDKLEYWTDQFKKFMQMLPEQQAEYISKLTIDSNFLDLYDKWLTAYKEDKPKDFNCGYTNIISLPIGSSRTIIPDPMFCKLLERGLKRPLTEEELRNESAIYIKKKKVRDKWFLGSHAVVIPYIVLPDEDTV